MTTHKQHEFRVFGITDAKKRMPMNERRILVYADGDWYTGLYSPDMDSEQKFEADSELVGFIDKDILYWMDLPEKNK